MGRRKSWEECARTAGGGAVALFLLFAPAARAGDVVASPPRDLSVTIYRAPWRNGGAINLAYLGGFALIKETRTVRLTAGESRLRFEGVVDGIQSASAIVTGLPQGVIEKNRDAAVLSPEALIHAAQGAQVTLVRTARKTGLVTRTPARIVSANEDGVIFATDAGIEAFKCSGLPETFTFARTPAGLASTPTLSVLTRTPRAITATVTLSYLASGFDWSAAYVAKEGADGRTLDLTAWITLANNNSVSIANAHTQIVAGRLNRAGGDAEIGVGAPRVIARCWPQGTTSDELAAKALDKARPWLDEVETVGQIQMRIPAPLALAVRAPAPPPPPPPPEQLGDLKLYRLGEPTTVAARQAKQVRMLEQSGVPFTRLYGADLVAASRSSGPAQTLLRTKNDKADNLGLPLPAGRVALFADVGSEAMLTGETDLRDTAEGEDVELKLGPAPDIEVTQKALRDEAGSAEIARLSPELLAIAHHGRGVEEVTVSNARDTAAPFELRLRTFGGQHVVDADAPMAMKDGRPIFRFNVPANGATTIRYAVTDR